MHRLRAVAFVENSRFGVLRQGGAHFKKRLILIRHCAFTILEQEKYVYTYGIHFELRFFDSI